MYGKNTAAVQPLSLASFLMVSTSELLGLDLRNLVQKYVINESVHSM
jgi:hypothetical protein